MADSKEKFDIEPIQDAPSIKTSYNLTPIGEIEEADFDIIPIIVQNDFNESLSLPVVTSQEEIPVYELTVPVEDFAPSLPVLGPIEGTEAEIASILAVEKNDNENLNIGVLRVIEDAMEEPPELDPLGFTFHETFNTPTISSDPISSLEPPKVETHVEGTDFFKLLGGGIYDIITFNEDGNHNSLDDASAMDKLRGGIGQILNNKAEDPFDMESTASKLIKFDKSKEEIRAANSWFWDKPSVDKGFERTERLLTGVNAYEQFYNPNPPKLDDWSDLKSWDKFWSPYLEGHLSTALDDASDIIQKDIIGNLFHNPLSFGRRGGDGSVLGVEGFTGSDLSALEGFNLENLGAISAITPEIDAAQLFDISAPIIEEESGITEIGVQSSEEEEEAVEETLPTVVEEIRSETIFPPTLDSPSMERLLDGPKAKDNYSGLAGADDFGGTFGFVSYVGTGTRPRQSQEPIFQNGDKKYHAKDDTPLFSQMISNVDFLFPYQYNMFIIGNEEENPFETVNTLQSVQVDGVTLDKPINYKLKGFGVPALKRNSQNIIYGHMSQRVALADRVIEYKSEIEVMSNRDLQNFLKFCKLAGVGVYQKLLNLSLNMEDSFNIASTNDSQRVDLNVVSSYDYQEEGNNVYLTLLKPSYINNESLYGGSVSRVGVNGVDNWVPESTPTTCFKFYNFRVISIKDMSFSFNNSRENDNPFTFKAVVAWSRMEQLQIG